MGQFGVFDVSEPTFVAYGNLELELPAGRYEPQSAAELEALRHLVNVPLPHGTDAHAICIEDPASAPVGVDTALTGASPEPSLPEPPPAPAAFGATDLDPEED
jgi:hypothetical protein